MRELAGAEKIRTFMCRLGNAADRPTRKYLTGGGTAALLGWRPSTIDVDPMLRNGLVIADKLRELFRAIEPRLIRYPAIHPPAFAGRVEAVVSGRS